MYLLIQSYKVLFPDSKYSLLKPCPEDKVCVSELMIDWLPRGEQLVIMNRKCDVRPVTPGGQQCIEENYSTFMWKDCVEYCETQACNNDMEGVINLHDQGNDLQCHQCKYAKAFDGSILNGSNEKCKLQDVSNADLLGGCPR